MSLLVATHLSKSYGPQDIFNDVSASIPKHARIGLVGPNGVGKTTLLRILIGEEEASGGKLTRAKNLSIGYLPQEAQFDSEHTLWEECLTAFTGLLALQAELTRLEMAMSDPDQAEEAIQTYGRLQQDFEHRGGYTYETRIRLTLSGLGFQEVDYQRPLPQLSGGQRTRALLAKLLLTSPDLLLLDEPTNHLDIGAVEWLERYLADWDGAVLIVSHDRYFLDRVATTIWEMTPALEIYPGNYSAYLAQREAHYQRRLEEYQTQQEFIEKEEEYIRRNLAGQNTKQAQGRRKRLERLLEEARLTPPMAQRRLHLRLQFGSRSGDLVLRTRQLEVGYADEGHPLFSVPDLTLIRGECAAIIGPNGAGKTTFLKTLLGQTPPYSGEVILGSSLKIGYFAQAHEDLRPENDLMTEIQRVAPKMLPAEIRNYLASFLFTGDSAFQPVETLSGGERGRLALAKLALGGANLLLLDEPTNHLDLPSQDILQTVLSDYRGTILLVSHDRYLIDALATQIWDVDPQQGLLSVFEGTYSEYRMQKEMEVEADQPVIKNDNATVDLPATPTGKKATGKTLTGYQRRLRLEELETLIADLDYELAEITRQLENPSDDAGKVQRLGQEYVNLQSKLDMLMTEWEELQDM
jgi:ATP-binding cassette subfamily F protein 3